MSYTALSEKLLKSMKKANLPDTPDRYFDMKDIMAFSPKRSRKEILLALQILEERGLVHLEPGDEDIYYALLLPQAIVHVESNSRLQKVKRFLLELLKKLPLFPSLLR